nr:MAG TPA: hypothetical protein [Caudoviricetes sp.]
MIIENIDIFLKKRSVQITWTGPLLYLRQH